MARKTETSKGSAGRRRAFATGARVLRVHKARFLVAGAIALAVILVLFHAEPSQRVEPVSEDPLRRQEAGARGSQEHPGEGDSGHTSARREAAMSSVRPQQATAPAEPVPLPPKTPPILPELAYVPPATLETLEKEAFEVANRAVAEFPDRTDSIGLLGMVHIHLGNAGEAAKCWEKCLELDPNRADAYLALARLVRDQGKNEEAVALSRKALELNPKLPEVHYILAQALLGLGNPKEAVGVLEEQIKASPDPSENDWLDDAYCLAGTAREQLGENEKAAENFQKAIEIDPDYTEAYYGLGTVCARLGEKEKARQHMEKFKAMKARDTADHTSRRRLATDEDWVRQVVARTYTDAGAIYFGNRRLREAEEHWRKAAILAPDDIACREELASLYERTGRIREALEICEQLRRLDPNNALYHANIGVLYARMNRIGAAIAAVRRAMELNPDNVQYRRIYEQLRAAD